MHNFTVALPVLLKRYQTKKQRRRVKGTMKKIVGYCL
jgi:hypothetical protein